ncbi:HAD-IC family P-type ATPase, partial [Eubacteriales bacterium OttesenSCG-928-N13]|nr:HAD-IC family P-type ATPase [Eubacteriales bacterium OttesenSCG-928-N13]
FAAALEKPSEHPLAQAVVRHAGDVQLDKVEQFMAVPGQGVQANIDGRRALAGNRRMMGEQGVDISLFEQRAMELERQGKSCLFFAQDGKVAGVLALADQIKPSSSRAVKELIQMGVTPVMLTGDNEQAARAVAQQVGIEQVRAQVLPQDKEAEVRALQERGMHVAMVGDGINDAPALTRADVGLAIGAGTDIAIESADVVLMKGDLMDAVDAVRISRAVIRNIRQNLFWAFFYNVIGIPLAAGVFYTALGWLLNPMIGAAAMSLSSVCVVSNALRLRRFKGHAA